MSFKRDVFRCFESSCQKQGNVLDYWSHYRGLPLYEAALDLAQTFQIPIPKKTQADLKCPSKKEQKMAGIPRPPLDYYRYI